MKRNLLRKIRQNVSIFQMGREREGKIKSHVPFQNLRACDYSVAVNNTREVKGTNI